jgi:hypothetical protein
MKTQILFLALAIFLGACTKEIIREKSPEAAPNTNPKADEGTIDSGGGNGLAGKPLESYRVAISTDEDVLKLIAPIVNNVLEALPRFAGHLNFILRERSWYIVPAKLKALPQTVIGIYFAADQFGLQNQRDVWINQDDMASMKTPEDKVNFIMHEMVMGVRILPFTTRLDNCLADISYKYLKKEAGYGGERNRCVNHYGLDSRFEKDPLIELDKSDYASVRDLTYKLMSTQGKIDAKEMAEWLVTHGFRNYTEE